MSVGVSYWSIEEIDGRRRIQFPNWDAIRLSRKQAEYFFADEQLELVMAGRGFGKDHLALLKKIRRGFYHYMRRRTMPEWNRPGIVWHLGVMAGESGNYADNINKLMTFLPEIPGKRKGRPLYYFDRHNQKFHLFGENQFVISLISLYGEGGQRGPGYDDVLVTEAQDITEDKFISVVLPMVIRPGYDDYCVTAVGTGKCNWFDAACEQAALGDPADYYGNWRLFTGTTFDSPKLNMAGAQQILREKGKNPQRFLRERLGVPNIVVPEDVTPDCPFHTGLIECALTKERLTLNGPPLVVFDLMYGGRENPDDLWRGVWNKERAALVHVRRWTQDELKLDPNNPETGIAKLFADTAAEYPGCTIAYDKQGRYGGAVAAHVPRHIRLVPMTRDNHRKNANVEDFLERCANVDKDGRSLGIRLPHPDSPHLTERERADMREMLKQLFHYRKVVKESPDGKMRYHYTKGEGYKDDGVDLLTWSCGQLPPTNRGGKLNGAAIRARILS